MPELDFFASRPAFEEICQADLAERFDAAAVGHWWGPVDEVNASTGARRTVMREADGVALDDSGAVVALATCKWTAGPVEAKEIGKLQRIAARLAPGRAIPFVVYARAGVVPAIAKAQERDPSAIRILAPADLYAG